jgi:WD40 repeat protein
LRELAEALDGSGDEPIAVVRLPWLDGPAGQLQTYDGHTDHITALAVSASGNLLASAAEDSSVCLWHLPTGKRIWRHTAETRNLNGVAVTPDERLVISNHDNNQLFLLNATTGKPVTQIPTSARSPTELDVTPDGECLIWATRSRPPNLLIWSLSHHRVLARLGEGEYPGVIDVSADGRFVVTGDSHGMVRLWDTVAGTAIRELAIHQDAITDIALSPGGDLVASATYDKLDVRELDTGESRLCLDVPSARTVAFSPDGRRLVSGGFREEVFVWDLASGHQLASLRAERAFSDRYVLRLAFLPDPRGLVTGATDGRIRLWRLPD